MTNTIYSLLSTLVKTFKLSVTTRGLISTGDCGSVSLSLLEIIRFLIAPSSLQFQFDLLHKIPINSFSFL